MNWKAILSAVAAAALIDVRTFYRARKLDKTAPFHWDLFFTRLVEGLLAGLAAGSLG